MKTTHVSFICLAIILVSFFSAAVVDAHVPVRISIKFILDANGNRPATGALNTDEEINAEFTAAIDILSRLNSELTVERIEFVDLSGLSQWYGTSAATDAGRDAVRNAALASPAAFHWRSDAINIYINGGPSSAISDFPPNNNIILMNQGCGNQPSCILHEIGHSLNLMHTHETSGGNGDACGDTITDNKTWTKNQLAQNNFGCLYLDCSAAQKGAVDLVYNNVMSYHVDEPQTRLSPCQMDRISSQSDGDKNWLLAKLPVYVDKSRFVLFQLGTFGLPYTSLQNALDAGGITNRVLVLQQGAYTMTQETIHTNVEIVTRSGPSTVSHPGVQSYVLPVDLENSKHPRVRDAVRASQDEERNGRKVIEDAENAVKTAGKAEEKSAIRAEAKEKQKIHRDKAVKGLLEAEQYAEKDEKIAIQLELAQRYRDAGDYERAILYFTKVAVGTDQPNLKQVALFQIDTCRKRMSRGGQ